MILWVLSLAIKTDFECFDPPAHPTARWIVKDAALAQWFGAFPAFDECPKLQGMTLLRLELGGGARAYLRAWRGSLLMPYVSPRKPGTLAPPQRRAFLGFSVTRIETIGPFEEYETWAGTSEEDLQWIAQQWATVYGVRIPFWFPLVLFGVFPFLVLVLAPLRRRARRNRNECVHCGYNMTGNESGDCSECGKAICL